LSHRNDPLDHTTIAVPFVASEDAETMDEVFRGTEEDIERMCAAVLINCKLSDSTFLAHVKRWLHDGKGLMASKSVSVVIAFP
jgi:alcohol oxidase